MSPDTQLNIGLIGAGRIGQVHAANLARVPALRLAAVADVHLPAAQAVAARHNVPQAVDDYQRLLADPGLDAVLVASATNTHTEIITQASAAGKHVFCEKPIDHSLARIDAALAAAAQAGIKLQIGFNRRFDPNFRRVRELVAEGKVGTPHLLRIISRDPAPPSLDYLRVSGGLFLDMTIHDFDMSRYLMGDEVEEIYAAGVSLVDPAIGEIGDIDTAVLTLRFASGALGVIDNSRQAVYGHDQRVEVFGSGGMVTVANNTPDTHVLSDEAGVHSAKPLYFFLERYAEAYAAEMQAFAACILEDTPPPVTGQDGRVPVVMALAAQKSNVEKRPVRLSEISA